MDVGDWLRSLGLGQYEPLFRENEIDAEVLPDLTEADLEKIGVPWGIASACSRRSQIWARPKRRRNRQPPRGLKHLRTPPSAASSR